MASPRLPSFNAARARDPQPRPGREPVVYFTDPKRPADIYPDATTRRQLVAAFNQRYGLDFTVDEYQHAIDMGLMTWRKMSDDALGR